MVRPCGTPGCSLRANHLGWCNARPTRSICKVSSSSEKLEASRRDRFGAAAGGRRSGKPASSKMLPPKFTDGDRVEVVFGDNKWYAGVVRRWVRLPRIRSYKYDVEFDSGLRLDKTKFAVEECIVAEGATKPALPSEPSGMTSAEWRRSSNAFSEIQTGDRVRVAWSNTERYEGFVVNTTQRLERKKAVRGIASTTTRKRVGTLRTRTLASRCCRRRRSTLR